MNVNEMVPIDESPLPIPTEIPDKPVKKSFRKLLWIITLIIITVILILAFWQNKQGKYMQDNFNQDLDNFITTESKMDGFKEFAEETIKKCQSNDVLGIEQVLISNYAEMFPDENTNDYFTSLCEKVVNAKIGDGTDSTIGKDKLNNPELVYRKKMTLDGNPFILALGVVKESDKIRLFDMTIQADKNPEVWTSQ